MEDMCGDSISAKRKACAIMAIGEAADGLHEAVKLIVSEVAHDTDFDILTGVDLEKWAKYVLEMDESDFYVPGEVKEAAYAIEAAYSKARVISERHKVGGKGFLDGAAALLFVEMYF